MNLSRKERKALQCLILFRCNFDGVHIHFNNRRNLRRLPLGFPGIFGPGKGQVEHLPRALCLFQYRKRFEQHGPLSLPVPHGADRPPKGIFDRGYPRDTHCSVILRNHGQGDGGKPFSLKKPGHQSHGLATKRSDRRQNHCFHPFVLHVGENPWHGFFEQDFRI